MISTGDIPAIFRLTAERAEAVAAQSEKLTTKLGRAIHHKAGTKEMSSLAREIRDLNRKLRLLEGDYMAIEGEMKHDKQDPIMAKAIAKSLAEIKMQLKFLMGQILTRGF